MNLTTRTDGFSAPSGPQRPFVIRGSEHFRFEGTLIEEIRQYWTFDAEKLDTGLIGYPYGDTK